MHSYTGKVSKVFAIMDALDLKNIGTGHFSRLMNRSDGYINIMYKQALKVLKVRND